MYLGQYLPVYAHVSLVEKTIENRALSTDQEPGTFVHVEWTPHSPEQPTHFQQLHPLLSECMALAPLRCLRYNSVHLRH